MQILEQRIEKTRTEPRETKKLRIVIAGGNGHVGNLLARYFHEHGHSVVVLARTTYLKPWREVAWDGEHLREWVRELEGADAVINLVGRSVNCRYNVANRREILESRVKSTKLKTHSSPRAPRARAKSHCEAPSRSVRTAAASSTPCCGWSVSVWAELLAAANNTSPGYTKRISRGPLNS